MILRVDVVDRALEYAKGKRIKENGNRKILLLDPQGVPFTQGKAQELSAYNHLILVCGHYEGVDERIRSLVDEELSVGDYILTGGEIAAMAVVDSVVRLLPGVIAEGAAQTESFTANMLEYPQYTRPERYKRRPVPQVLVSGNHEQIRLWRSEQSRKRTKKRRPDLTERTNTRT
jgi:tRNA (guanine37-N1)-methyltransferase